MAASDRPARKPRRTGAPPSVLRSGIDGPLTLIPGHLLRRCQQRAVDLFVAEVGEQGPTPPQFALLLAVFQHPGASQAELVRLSGIDRSTLAEMVRRMAARGWLRRRRTARDQRANALAITAAGRAALDAACPAMRRAQARILEPLPARRRAAFLADLALVSGLGEGTPEGTGVAGVPERLSRRRTRSPGPAAARASS